MALRGFELDAEAEWAGRRLLIFGLRRISVRADIDSRREEKIDASGPGWGGHPSTPFGDHKSGSGDGSGFGAGLGLGWLRRFLWLAFSGWLISAGLVSAGFWFQPFGSAGLVSAGLVSAGFFTIWFFSFLLAGSGRHSVRLRQVSVSSVFASDSQAGIPARASFSAAFFRVAGSFHWALTLAWPNGRSNI